MKTKKLSEREEFAKELLDGLDLVRDNSSPNLARFIDIFKDYIREIRDSKRGKIMPTPFTVGQEADVKGEME